MKKIISLIAVLFTAIVLTGCSGELDSLEWSQLPESVYEVVDKPGQASAEENFMTAAKVKINGNEVTLKDAVEKHGATVTGFDLTSKGSKVITVKYASLTIYWAYQVIAGDIPSNEVTPEYDWYDGQSSPYTLASIEDLYGFANFVNGKRPDHQAYSFAGDTVELGANIDLTGKVWEPIGAAPRKLNVPLDYLGKLDNAPGEYHKIYFLGGKLYHTDPSKATPVQIVASEDALKAKLNLEMNKGKYYIGQYLFAQEDSAGKYQYNGKKYKFYFSSDEILGNFFEGTFDGQGRKITGLSDVGYTPTVTLTYANSNTIISGYTFGLFGVVNGDVTVKNLRFEDVSIVGAYYDSEVKSLVLAEIDSVGAAIGYAFGTGDLTIENVSVLSGTIFASGAGAGIIGRGYNVGKILIQNCENRANVTIGEAGHGGGIGGYFNNQVEFKILNCTNYGNITSIVAKSATKGAGGIINRSNNEVTFENCRNFGNINGMNSVTDGKGIWTGNKPNLHHLINCQNYGTLQPK